MIINREVTSNLRELARQFSAVAVMGPRQSGKSTLVKETFPDYAYVSLEELDYRQLAKNDPRTFLASYQDRKGVIIDEIQEVPELLSYMQGIIDKQYRPGFFIITGSQNFLMHEKITQTLAGRIALLTLLPLSLNELKAANLLSSNPFEALLIKGFYPQLHATPTISVQTWCANYVNTYVEKDVRQVLKITDVLLFQKFLKVCAARVGNLVNYSDLARDCDISPHTAKEWISVLETSYIVKLIAPYYRNFNKRLTQSPKLFFNDTSLVCALLNIKTVEDLAVHPSRGAIFETFVVSELFKYNFNHNQVPQIYFWRDAQGHEIDVLIEKSLSNVVPIEIKSGRTVNDSFFKGLIDWHTITGQNQKKTYVVYGGDEFSSRPQGTLVPWNSVATMADEIYIK